MILAEVSAWLIISAQLRPAPHRSAIVQQRSAVQCRALRCPAVPAVPCRAVRYCAMLCGVVRSCAVPCCAVLSASLCILFRACATTTVVSCQVPAELGLAHQLSSAQLSSAAHRSASSAERSAVWCRSLPLCAVLCRAACFAVLTRSYMPESFEVSYYVPVLLL